MQIDLKQIIKNVGNLPDAKIYEAENDVILSKNLKTSFPSAAEAGLASFQFKIDPSLGYKCTRKALEGQKIKSTGNVFLVHEVRGGLEGSAAAQIGSHLQMGFQGSKSFALLNYRLHGSASKISSAISSDFLNFGSILNENYVLSMQKGHAVGLAGSGHLKFEVKASWSDVFSGQFSLLSSVIGPNSVGVEVGASAELSFGVEIKDDYEAYIESLGQDRFKVALRKINSKTNSAGLDLKATLGFEEKSVAQVADKIFGAIEKKAFAELARWEGGKKILADISSTDIAKAAAAMGLDQQTVKEEVAKVYQQKRNQLLTKIKKVAETRMELGLSYQYQKSQTRESLLELELNAHDLQQHHSKIWKLQLDELLEVAKNDSTILVTNFFERLTTNVKKQFGISLKLGKLELKKATRKEFTEELEYSGENRAIRVSNYKRNTTEEKNKDQDYYLDFVANMPEFVENEKQLSCDRFLFAFKFGYTQNVKSDLLLAEDLADMAILWKQKEPQEFDDLRKSFKTKLNKAKEIRLDVSMEVSELEQKTSSLATSKLDDFVQVAGKANRRVLAGILASSLPYADLESYSITDRQSVTARTLAYDDLWYRYLGTWKNQVGLEGEQMHAFWRNFILESLEASDADSNIVRFEKRIGSNKVNIRKVDSILFRCIPGRDLSEMQKAYSILSKAVLSKSNYKTPFKNFQKHWDNIEIQHPYIARFLGAFMVNMAHQIGLEESKISVSIRVKYKKGSKEQVLHII
jgi:hypothetical protein